MTVYYFQRSFNSPLKLVFADNPRKRTFMTHEEYLSQTSIVYDLMYKNSRVFSLTHSQSVYEVKDQTVAL